MSVNVSTGYVQNLVGRVYNQRDVFNWQRSKDSQYMVGTKHKNSGSDERNCDYTEFINNYDLGADASVAGDAPAAGTAAAFPAPTACDE